MDVLKNKSLQKSMPFLGYGLGLRTDYYEEILTTKPPVDWFEILTENYLVPGGKPLYYLDKIRAEYPVVMHGVSLSLGSTEPFDKAYLTRLKELVQRVEPKWVSDHLCWTGVQGINAHDLLPIPYTYEAVRHTVSRIQQVQDFLGQAILIENVSSYLTYKQSELTEWDFILDIVRQAGCFILLDVNNVYVSSVNHQFNPLEFIHAMPPSLVAQIHLAGHSNHGDYIIDTHDTHDAPVVQEVWDLYSASIKHLGAVSTMVERDDNMPPFAELLAEMQHANYLADEVQTKELCV
jgi:hypothetical protein